MAATAEAAAAGGGSDAVFPMGPTTTAGHCPPPPSERVVAWLEFQSRDTSALVAELMCSRCGRGADCRRRDAPVRRERRQPVRWWSGSARRWCPQAHFNQLLPQAAKTKPPRFARVARSHSCCADSRGGDHRCGHPLVALAVSSGLQCTIHCTPVHAIMSMHIRPFCQAALTRAATRVAASLHWLQCHGASVDADACASQRVVSRPEPRCHWSLGL